MKVIIHLICLLFLFLITALINNVYADCTPIDLNVTYGSASIHQGKLTVNNACESACSINTPAGDNETWWTGGVSTGRGDILTCTCKWALLTCATYKAPTIPPAGNPQPISTLAPTNPASGGGQPPAPANPPATGASCAQSTRYGYCTYACGCTGGMTCGTNGCDYYSNTPAVQTPPSNPAPYQPVTRTSAIGEFCGTASNGDTYVCPNATSQDSFVACEANKCIEHRKPGNKCDASKGIECAKGAYCTSGVCLERISGGQKCDPNSTTSACVDPYKCTYDGTVEFGGQYLCEQFNGGPSSGDYSCNPSNGNRCQAGYTCSNQNGGNGICQGAEGKECEGLNSGTCQSGLHCLLDPKAVFEYTCQTSSQTTETPTPSPQVQSNGNEGSACDGDSYDTNLDSYPCNDGLLCKNKNSQGIGTCTRPGLGQACTPTGITGMSHECTQGTCQACTGSNCKSSYVCKNNSISGDTCKNYSSNASCKASCGQGEIQAIGTCISGICCADL